MGSVVWIRLFLLRLHRVFLILEMHMAECTGIMLAQSLPVRANKKM